MIRTGSCDCQGTTTVRLGARVLHDNRNGQIVDIEVASSFWRWLVHFPGEWNGGYTSWVWLTESDEFQVKATLPPPEIVADPEVLRIWWMRDIVYDMVNSVNGLMLPMRRLIAKRGIELAAPVDDFITWSQRFESIPTGQTIVLGIDPSFGLPTYVRFH